MKVNENEEIKEREEFESVNVQMLLLQITTLQD